MQAVFAQELADLVKVRGLDAYHEKVGAEEVFQYLGRFVLLYELAWFAINNFAQIHDRIMPEAFIVDLGSELLLLLDILSSILVLSTEIIVSGRAIVVLIAALNVQSLQAFPENDVLEVVIIVMALIIEFLVHFEPWGDHQDICGFREVQAMIFPETQIIYN